MIHANGSRKASDRRRRFDHPKKFICTNTRSAAQFAAVFNLSVMSAGAMFLANILAVPAAGSMRGELHAGRKCADRCPGAADNSKLE
jgi:hypothetical protein